MKRRRLLHARRGKRVVSGEEFGWRDERGRGCVGESVNFVRTEIFCVNSTILFSGTSTLCPPSVPPRLPPPPLSSTLLLKDATIVAPNSSPTTETNEAGLESETV